MLSKEFIELQKKQLTDLGNKLDKEARFAQQLIDSGKRPPNEVSWFRSVRLLAIHGTFQIQNFLKTLDDYQDKQEEQIGFYIGKMAIQSFLEIINAFEQRMNKLVNSSPSLSSLLKERIEKKVEIITKGWKEDANRKSRDFRDDLIKAYERKLFEMKFIRDSLKKEGIIDKLDYKILEFSWDIRNSMHNDFLAIKDIEFSAPGTSLNYSFAFKKGEELYHPKDLSAFYSMTEQIIFILHKILQHFNKLDEERKS
ncbi:MAG: hypothetical protein ABJP45_00450 [Cyclobacteriaceae bacterium]